MRLKTHLNNALYQITAVCFEHEHELVIAELQLVIIDMFVPYEHVIGGDTLCYDFNLRSSQSNVH